MESLSSAIERVIQGANVAAPLYHEISLVYNGLLQSCLLLALPSQRNGAIALINQFPVCDRFATLPPESELEHLPSWFGPWLSVFDSNKLDTTEFVKGLVFAIQHVNDQFINFYVVALRHALEALPAAPTSFSFPWVTLLAKRSSVRWEVVIALLPCLLNTTFHINDFRQSDCLELIMQDLETGIHRFDFKDKTIVKGILRLIHCELDPGSRKRLSVAIIDQFGKIVGADTVRYSFPPTIRLFLSVYISLLYYPESSSLVESSNGLRSFARKCFRSRDSLLIDEAAEDATPDSDEEASKGSKLDTAVCVEAERARRHVIFRAMEWCQSMARAFAQGFVPTDALRELENIVNPVLQGLTQSISIEELVWYLFPFVEAPDAALVELCKVRFHRNTHLLHLLVRSKRFDAHWYRAVRNMGLDMNAPDYEGKTLLKLCCELRPIRRTWLAWLVLDETVNVSKFRAVSSTSVENVLDSQDLMLGCLAHLIRRGAFTSIHTRREIIELTALVDHRELDIVCALVWGTSVPLSSIGSHARANLMRDTFEFLQNAGKLLPAMRNPSQCPLTLKLFLFLRKATLAVNLCVGTEVARRRGSPCPLRLLRQDILRKIIYATLGG